jgi:hypothetical protein
MYHQPLNLIIPPLQINMAHKYMHAPMPFRAQEKLLQASCFLHTTPTFPKRVSQHARKTPRHFLTIPRLPGSPAHARTHTLKKKRNSKSHATAAGRGCVYVVFVLWCVSCSLTTLRLLDSSTEWLIQNLSTEYPLHSCVRSHKKTVPE